MSKVEAVIFDWAKKTLHLASTVHKMRDKKQKL